MTEEERPDGKDPPNGVEPEPNIGTLAWLQQQEHIDWEGLRIPHCHRVPEGSTLATDGVTCRVVRPDGSRCRAIATRSYGLCLVHAGGGGGHDPAGMARKATQARMRLAMQRKMLGVGATRIADPRQIARVHAQNRAAEIAEAVWAPLDDDDLGALAKQGAVLRALDATFPLATVTVDVELPEAEAVAGMDWQQMQVLAARMLADTERPSGAPPELEPASTQG